MSLVKESSEQIPDSFQQSTPKKTLSKKRIATLSSGVATAVLAVSFSITGDKSQLTTASAQTFFMFKMTSELGGQNRRARMITADELETLLPSARRYELVEEAKWRLYPGLDFSTDIDSKKNSKGSILDRILNIFRETILANPLHKLKIQDLSQDHIIKLIKLTAENPISRANFAPLFVVGIHGEALTSQEIYQDQRVVTVIPDIERETIHKILTLSDIVPLDIYAVEHRGQIYVRKVASSASHSELRDALFQYENGVLSLEALSRDLQTIERDTFIWAPGTPLAGQSLPVTHAMTLRYITQTTFEEAVKEVGETVSLSEAIESIVTQSNHLYFSRKYAREIEEVSKKYPSHTTQDTRLLLTLIGRVNPDFSSTIEWGLARVNLSLYTQTRSELALMNPTKTVADDLAIVWHLYHSQIVQNTEISILANQAKELNDAAAYTSKDLDIIRQVRGIFFILKTFIAIPPPPTDLQRWELQQIIETRLWVKLDISDPQIDNAYFNGAYLKKLQEIGIIPIGASVEPGDLLTVDDFVGYVNDLAGYLGIDGLELPKSSITATEKNKAAQSTIASLSKYFWYQARGNMTLCMVNVRNGLSRLTGVPILGKWDMVDIFRDGINNYAATIQSDFEKVGAASKFLGYDSEFGKSHFNAPEWANMGMLFTDTTKRGQWGHVSAIIRGSNGTWFVKDDYYKGPLGAFKSVGEFWSDKNPWIWKKYDLAKNPNKMQGAIFFNGDISKITFPSIANDPKIASK